MYQIAIIGNYNIKCQLIVILHDIGTSFIPYWIYSIRGSSVPAVDQIFNYYYIDFIYININLIKY